MLMEHRVCCPSSFKILTAPSCSPRIAHTFLPVRAALGFAGDGHLETGQVHLPLPCCPTGFMVWAPSSHAAQCPLQNHCSADIPKVADGCPVFPGLFALPVCLWLTAGRCLSPSWLPGGMLGWFASWQCPVCGGTGMQGMLQTHCSHGACLGTAHCQQQPMDQRLGLP